MFSERWKQETRGEARGGQFPPSPSSLLDAPRGGSAGGDGRLHRRHSNGLEQFFNHIKGQAGLNLLDLSGASQANITFITNLGHKLYSENLLATLDLAFSPGDFYANQDDAGRQQAFLAQFLTTCGENEFDGALVWDVLEFVAPSLLKPVLERFSRILRPGSYLLAMFHAEERAEQIPTWNYRIHDAGTLLLGSRGLRRPAQFFNNRAVEKLFQSFESVKFFLTRDSLREVIAKR